MSSSLGIYFAPNTITLVETKGRGIISNAKVPSSVLSAGESEEKVPDDIKMVAILSEELRRNEIRAKEAFIALSGKDLIIRTFEMPLMPREELTTAIYFEASKHLPFKIEDLVLDYQVYLDKANNKNQILLIGIKKEVLAKYKSIFQQLNIKISSIEYAGFSILRLLKLTGNKSKGIVSILNADLAEADEANFMVVEDSFPLFSRDIVLKSMLEDAGAIDQRSPGMLLERLKTEIRISLDYYQRNFPLKKIKRNLFILNKDYMPDIEAFTKEIDINIEFLELNKCFNRPVHFSTTFIKGYAVSLSKVVKSPLKMDLLVGKENVAKEPAPASWTFAALYKDFHIDSRMLFLGLLICLMALGVGFYQRLPVEKDLKGIINIRPDVAGVNPKASFEELSGISSEYNSKISKLDSFVKQQLYLTEPLNIIPRILPEGMWLKSFVFDKTGTRAQLELEGMVYLGDSNKEFELVNSFLDNLKQDAFFGKNFKDISVAYLDRNTEEGAGVTNFKIICRNYKSGT